MDCQKINDCTIRLSSVDDKWHEFGNHCNKEHVLFIVYADLEYVLRNLPLYERVLLRNMEDASSYQQDEVLV